MSSIALLDILGNDVKCGAYTVILYISTRLSLFKL